MKKLYSSGSKRFLAKRGVPVCIFHKKYLVSTIMDREGKVLKRARVSTDRESIRPVKAVMKATISIDSNTLAHLVRSDVIPRVYMRSFETRDLRNLLRFGMAILKDST